jgi:hypothetical protein
MIQQSRRVDEEEETAAARRKLILAGAAAALLLVLGTVAFVVWGGGSDAGASPTSDPDRFQIEQTVGRFEDAANSKTGMKGVFAADALPTGAAARAYQKYGYRTAGRIDVSGSTATVPVSITDAKSGAEVAKNDWTFVKEGDAWKIKSAPLP